MYEGKEQGECCRGGSQTADGSPKKEQKCEVMG